MSRIIGQTYQLIWQDATGEHMFISSEAGAKQAAQTLLIALQSSGSATWAEIIEVNSIQDGLGGKLTFDRLVHFGERK